MPFEQLLSSLWRAKFVLLTAALVAASLGFFGSRLGSPRYASEGQLLIESREPVIAELGQTAASGPVGLQRVRTEGDILRSRRLAEEVARKLDLAETFARTKQNGLSDQILQRPRAWRTAILARLGVTVPPPLVEDRLAETVAELQRQLEVRTADNSSVVTLHVVATDPQVAAAIVNTAMTSYLASDLKAKESTTAQANRWLTERLAMLHDEVEAADRRVQEMLRQSGLTQTSLGSTDAQQVREEQDRLAAARQDVSRAQNALSTALRMDRTGGQRPLTSPTIQALVAREAEIVQRAASMGQRLSEQHPDRIAVENELRAIRKQIEVETGKVIALLQRDMDAAQGRLEDAQNALGTARALAQTSRGSEVELAQLTREADARRQIYSDFLVRVEQTRFAAAQFPSARIVSPAVPAIRPVGPSTAIVVLLCGFAGLLLAAVAVVARQASDGSINSAADLVALTGRPNAASLPRLGRGKHCGMATSVLADGQSDVAETLRALRMTLQSIPPGGTCCSTLVVSPEVGDGKTTLAAALARLSAADGIKVLLIEGDMRRPRLAQLLGMPEHGDGLEAVLKGRAEVADVLYVDPASGLHCLLASRPVPQPQSLLQSEAFDTLISAARRRYQFIIIDSPPIMHVADALVLAPHSDAVLFVAAWRRSSRRVVREAMQRLPQSTRRKTATVFTQVRRSRLDSLDYYHGYAQSGAPRITG